MVEQYINNKNDVTFKTCVFYNNSAISPSFNTCGAAIYVDSSNSKVSLEHNIFVSNTATDDKGIYNCGKYETISPNWWGTNNPDFNEGQIIEWHRFTSNTKHSDNNYLKILLTADKTSMETNENVKLTFKFVNKIGGDITGKVNAESVNFYSNKKSNFSSKDVRSNGVTVMYTPFEGGEHIVTAKFYSFSVSVSIYVEDLGDFAKLQKLVNSADKELNLTRNYVYTIGKDSMTDGIVINKALTINGNGFTIDAQNKSRIFKIMGENVTINNITFINGFAIDGGAILVYNNYNAEIRNCIFENNTAETTGGAIEYIVVGKYGTIINSVFLNNKAAIDQFTFDKTNETLSFTLTGKENYIMLYVLLVMFISLM